ncbi:cysteine hydrolase family protein [Enterococcus hermanniensis]|uniref:Isochorismatase-like domain-containing protein n=1 Tax=Enterococcus hermanniensis TaxID=249189 RepID=A0A1L8TN33_9ENTE|nr:cysteine hydrolase family protein [Enterococcus hermanniensis]OJG45697.1 hypothetical protein RV04_GL001986 [Enterococcus hermanniensis]
METTSDALLVIDLQKGVCYGDQTIDQLSTLITLVNQRIETYREQRKSIIFIQHCDLDLPFQSAAWEILTDLKRKETDFIIQKTHANAFYQTDLQLLLQAHQISSLEICGAQTEFCVDTTIKFAHGLGYHLSMKRGASTTYDNSFLSAAETIAFYETIWAQRFLHFIE